MKVCKTCGIEKPLEDYYKGKNICKICFSERERLRYHEKMKNPEFKAKRASQKKQYSETPKGKEVQQKADKKRGGTHKRYEQNRNNHLKRKYNLTIEEWDKMYREQNGKCDCCGDHIKAKDMCTDHNHDTGEVRALLCSNCNTAAGLLKDSPSRVMKLYSYLTRRGYYGEH